MCATQVESEAIASLDYHNRVMTIEFEPGGVYAYYGVPRAVYDAFLAADSKGRFFHAHILERYRFKRLK